MRRVRVLMFGPVRDIVGAAELALDVAEPYTGTAAFDALVAQYPALGPWRESVRLAVNCDYAPFDRTIETNDELSFIPPVSGG